MFYYNEGGMTDIPAPVQKTFRVVFKEFSAIIRHVFRHVNRIMEIRLTHMSRYTVVMIEDFDTVFSSTDVHFLTNRFVWNRVLAIPSSY